MEHSQFSDRRVCAVVVTYHPTPQMIDNLADVFAQTQGLVVVDNGSNASVIQQLREASQNQSFPLIENKTNLGLAEALNQGVLWAKSQGFPWIILFDQDSRITPGFIDQMFASLEAHPQRERVASMHPRYIDPETGVEAKVWRAADGGPITSMTSGALMPAWIFGAIGPFAADYFIDELDTEYCYRIRAAGYLVADSRRAELLHHAGAPERIRFLGFSFGPTHHSTTRRYYMFRNRVVLYRKYFPIFPRWVLHSMNLALRDTAKCFLAEADRVHKFRNLVIGTWDGMIGRMGKRDGI